MWVLLSAPADARPVVLELYTSQGCSSCPAAEELIKTLQNKDVLALSMHISYWDYLGWKDPFATQENTLRQRAYAQILKDKLYTPQLVVDGAKSLVGTDEEGIASAIQEMKTNLIDIPITLRVEANSLHIQLPAYNDAKNKNMPLIATVWAMQYKKHETTDIQAGENKGKRLESLHNVIKLTHLGSWMQEAASYSLPIDNLNDDGLAIILQSESYGHMIGATVYNDNQYP